MDMQWVQAEFSMYDWPKTAAKTIEEKTHTRISAMEHKISTMDIELNKKIEGKINNMKDELQNEVVEKIKGGLQDDVRKEVREIEDQKPRALNLICFNIAESKSKSSDDRKKHDTEKFIELCHRIGVKEIDIKLALRLGTPQSGKIRLLQVIFNNKNTEKIYWTMHQI